MILYKNNLFSTPLRLVWEQWAPNPTLDLSGAEGSAQTKTQVIYRAIIQISNADPIIYLLSVKNV